MNANSGTDLRDPLYDRLKEMDFEEARPVAEVPALNRLQAERGGKSRITIRVDNRTLAAFKVRAAMTDGNYQTLMNEALAQFVQGQTLADVVRDTIRATLQKAVAR
jgi:predicted DNA binding CopG/RHH family protein